jgi:hypothetical protein
MGKRSRNKRRHLVVVREESRPFVSSIKPDCENCHGTGVVRDERDIACICVPCYLLELVA